MAQAKMKVNYDPDSDILYILFKEGPIKDTVEAAEDLFIETGENGEIAGIEIWRARETIMQPLAHYIKTLTSPPEK